MTVCTFLMMLFIVLQVSSPSSRTGLMFFVHVDTTLKLQMFLSDVGVYLDLYLYQLAAVYPPGGFAVWAWLQQRLWASV